MSRKKKKKQAKRIFREPEPESAATRFGPIAYAGDDTAFADLGLRKGDFIEYWDEFDVTFKSLGREAWEGDISREELFKHSVSYWRLVKLMDRDPALARQILRGQDPDRFLGMTASEYLTTASWHRAGHHLFRLWPVLAHALLDTEFSAPTDMIKLPFPSMYVHFPIAIGERIPVLHKGDGSVMPADGAYIHMPLGGEPADTISVRVMSISHSDPLVGSNYHYFQVPLDGGTLDEERIVKHNVHLFADNEADAIRVEPLRLALNALLYINSSGADIRWGRSERDRLRIDFSKNPNPKTKAKRERRKDAMTRASRVRPHEAGSTLRIPNVPSDNGSTEEHAAFKLAHRVQVRGHWRNQACGVGRAERKLIWIKPHYKGPEMAEVVNRRTYEVVDQQGRGV